MSSITIHALDQELDAAIRQKAKRDSRSLNKTIQLLLRQALMLNKDQVQSDFEQFFGSWTEEDATEFARSQEYFERVDEDEWK